MRRNLRTRAILISSIAIMIFSIAIGAFIYYFASDAIVENISESLTEIAMLGSKAVESSLKGSLEVIETIAAEEPIKDPNVSAEDKIKLLINEAKRKGFARMSIADASGNSVTTDGVRLYVGDREYFKLAIKGIKNISDPVTSRVDGTLIITFAVPIANGEDIIGVLYSTQNVEVLSQITDGIKLGTLGRSYIIDGMGTTIAHERRDQVSNRVNVILDWKELGFDESMHDFFINMQRNEKGAGQYIFDGQKTYAGYAKIPDTHWYFGISAPKTQVFKSIDQIYFFVGFLLLLIIVIFSAAQFYIRILRKNLATEKSIADAAIEAANLIIIGMDREGTIFEFNRYAEIKLGYKKEDIAGDLKLEDIINPDAAPSYDKLMEHIKSGKSLNSLELSLKNKAGDELYLLWNLNLMPDHEDEYFEIVGMNISERVKIEKDLIESHEELTSLYEELYASEETLREQYEELSEKEKSIHKLAYYDPLTGLSNRINLEVSFNGSVLNKDVKAALLYMDLDNFKFVNDTFGHSLGDELLVKVAENIKETVKEGYIAARLGGDEFMILITDYEDLEEIELFADRLLKNFEPNFHIGNTSINISTSIGIALYPDNGRDFKELLKCADIAMYAAKEAGRRNYIFFDKNMNDIIVRKMKIQNSMKKAMENNEFSLHYQPQYEIASNRIRAFEALLRWNSPEHGFVSPADFIGIAESSGLIVPLGEWVLNEACDFIKHVIDMGHENISISVNVSVIQLMQEDFLSMVDGVLKNKGLKPSYLELEITESVLIENIDLNMKKIKELRELGVKISLDDFGTGYSSLTYLRELPIDVLKIDKSFIDNILSTGEKSGLAGSIISLAHDLGLEVVAEGVENEEQLKYLEWYNCDVVQGYLFSRPLPGEKAMKLIP